MPGIDRTGPHGEGPRTGRALGKCNPGKECDLNTEDDDLRGGRGKRLRFGQGWWKGGGRDEGPGRRAGRGEGYGPGRGAGRGLGRGAGRGFGSGGD